MTGMSGGNLSRRRDGVRWREFGNRRMQVETKRCRRCKNVVQTSTNQHMHEAKYGLLHVKNFFNKSSRNETKHLGIQKATPTG